MLRLQVHITQKNPSILGRSHLVHLDLAVGGVGQQVIGGLGLHIAEPSDEFTSGHGSSDGDGAHHGATPQPVGAAVNDDADHGDEIYDVTPIEWVAWTPFLVFIVVFGVYPQLMFQVIDPAVTDMVARLGETLGP